MKNQALISSKDKSKKLKCRLLQFLFGALGSTVFPSKMTKEEGRRTDDKTKQTFEWVQNLCYIMTNLS